MRTALYLEVISKLRYIIDKTFVILAAFIFAITVVLNGVEICLRSFGLPSLYWIQEFTVVSFGYITFFALPPVFIRKKYIVVTFIYNLFPKSMQSVLTVLVDVLVLVFLITGVTVSYSYVVSVGDARTATMRLPLQIVYLPLLIGLAFLVLVMVHSLFLDIRKRSTLIHNNEQSISASLDG